MHFKEAKSIFTRYNGMNLYRGCTHGCIYCDSRSRCYHMQHHFEDVEVKSNAPELLEDALRRKRKRCMIGTGAMTDPYLPLEGEQQLTRRCLEIIERYGYGLAIQTKSNRIMRDLDLLQRINARSKCVVEMTLTTFDEELCRIVEPNVCTTRQRVEVLQTMREHGIPTVVWLCPILPFINDSEENLQGIMDYCVEAGVYGILNFGMGMTLREGNREYYYSKMDEHFPGLKERYQKTYGNAYEVSSPHKARLMRIFDERCREAGIENDTERIFEYMMTYEDRHSAVQMSIFEI